MGLFDRLRHRNGEPPRHPETPASAPPTLPPVRRDPDSGAELMEGFGYKCSWLAIRTDDQAAVVAALGVTDAEPVSWVAGVHAAYDGTHVLITPPLPGVGGSWVLVAGDPVETPLDQTIDLSRALDTMVHRYATWRTTGSVVWGRINRGDVERFFSKDDGTLNEWIGMPDEVEIGLGLGAYRAASTAAQAEAIDDADTDESYGWLTLGESDVVTVAEAWSVAPFDLDGPAPEQPPLVATPRTTG